MLRLPDHWVWDSWYTRDGDGASHAFFLRASRALLDPERRHHRAGIGHAISTDLRSWRLLPDALAAADSPSWDDLAVWTGCTVSGPDGRWYMFYTGVSRAERGLVQRIGLAISDDLVTWHRHGSRPLVEADPVWYETLDPSVWYEQAWRDPWVFPDPAGAGWHMLITARANHGPAAGRGVVGHATSPDLFEWTAQPPLSAPAGFGHLEVLQVAVVDGRPLLLFCTNAAALEHRVWVVPGATVTGHWDLAAARPLALPHVYAPRLVPDGGGWAVIGFLDTVGGRFVGELTDPVAVRYDPAAGLVVTGPDRRMPSSAPGPTAIAG
jgi:beta-fructofuranosidase